MLPQGSAHAFRVQPDTSCITLELHCSLGQAHRPSVPNAACMQGRWWGRLCMHNSAHLGRGAGGGHQQHAVGLADTDFRPRRHLRVRLQQYEPAGGMASCVYCFQLETDAVVVVWPLQSRRSHLGSTQGPGGHKAQPYSSHPEARRPPAAPGQQRRPRKQEQEAAPVVLLLRRHPGRDLGAVKAYADALKGTRKHRVHRAGRQVQCRTCITRHTLKTKHEVEISANLASTANVSAFGEWPCRHHAC